MNVTSGLGESLLPARFGAPPEIVLLTLRPDALDARGGTGR
jgi:predicted MPP superfamily phosphohydrolase